MLSEGQRSQLGAGRVVHSQHPPTLGSRYCMTEKTPFFISPAYWDPRMTISLCRRETSMEVEEVM